MDAFCDPAIETVVFMKSAQVGATEILNNILGYYIDQDPAPVLVVMPTIEVAQAWSKDRFASMIRDTPGLQGKIKDVKTRQSENTMLHKKFPGGHVTIAGSNSPSSLRSRPIRIVLCDDVDAFSFSAGVEGDPVRLAHKRATTFWNRKHYISSTPTVKDASRIEYWYQESDQRKFCVTCPACQENMILKWGQVKWPPGEPLKAEYECEYCTVRLNDFDKLNMVRHGQWLASKPTARIAGFWINELYSPWVSFAQIVSNFLEAKKSQETLKVWVNTSLAESWEEKGEAIDDHGLYERREEYGPIVPAGAYLLTCGVDVQDDRIEAEVVAWGKKEESWGIEYRTIHGSPAKPDTWKDVEMFLKNKYKHESGVELGIACTCIDTGGHHTRETYEFIKYHQTDRVFGTKGSNQPNTPLVRRPTRSNLGGIKLFNIGVNTGKENIYARLKITEHGPRYMHFPMYYDVEFFKQLTAEKRVLKYNKGFAHYEWVKVRDRNEALDIRVLSLAAYTILNPNMDKLAEGLKLKAFRQENAKKIQVAGDQELVIVERTPNKTIEPATKRHKFQTRPSGGKGWINGWRR